MLLVMGSLRAGDGEIERLKDAMRAQLEATRAEDGCLHYSFAADVLDPNLLHIAERWRDQAAIDAHMKSAHMAAFNQAMAGAKISELKLMAYDAATERALMGG